MGWTPRPQSGLSVGRPAHAIRAVKILLAARTPTSGREGSGACCIDDQQLEGGGTRRIGRR